MKTVRLYYENAYTVSFDASVVSCKRVDNGYELILDRTAFFPEEGGQTPDKGEINGVEVLDVQIKDGMIIHKVNMEFKEDSLVHGEIDWKYRFNNMQQHSGEHIFSGIACSNYGCDNVGFHLSDHIVTLDLNKPLTEEQIAHIEAEANKVIASNIEIIASFPSAETLKDLKYRSKIDLFEDVRIVTIPGVDICACCAPHVERTGEIGILKVQNLQNYKGGVRVSILCGFRAIEDYSKKMHAVNEISKMLSAKPDEIVYAVKKIHDDNSRLRFQLVNIKKQQLLDKLQNVIADKNNWIFTEDLDNNAMREGVNAMTASSTCFCGIFSGNDKEGYRFIIGAASKDAREVINVMKEEMAVRGGGQPKMVQGTVFGTKEQIKRILE